MGAPLLTLSKWLKQAATVRAMSSSKQKKPGSPVAGPKNWTAAEELRVVASAQGLKGAALGELLRREGLHESS